MEDLLKKNLDLLLKKVEPRELTYASWIFRDDKEVVLELIEQDGKELELAPNKTKGNEESQHDKIKKMNHSKDTKTTRISDSFIDREFSLTIEHYAETLQLPRRKKWKETLKDVELSKLGGVSEELELTPNKIREDEETQREIQRNHQKFIFGELKKSGMDKYFELVAINTLDKEVGKDSEK